MAMKTLFTTIAVGLMCAFILNFAEAEECKCKDHMPEIQDKMQGMIDDGSLEGECQMSQHGNMPQCADARDEGCRDEWKNFEAEAGNKDAYEESMECCKSELKNLMSESVDDKCFGKYLEHLHGKGKGRKGKKRD